MNDAVRDAMDRAVGGLGRQVVEQDDRGAVSREIMLEREDLTTIAQRALREQTNFREAVDHHPHGLEPLDGIENSLHGFAELEVRRIEQALVMIRVQHAFRRNQFADHQVVANRPAV
jgi:hypothetical protein